MRLARLGGHKGGKGIRPDVAGGYLQARRDVMIHEETSKKKPPDQDPYQLGGAPVWRPVTTSRSSGCMETAPGNSTPSYPFSAPPTAPLKVVGCPSEEIPLRRAGTDKFVPPYQAAKYAESRALDFQREVNQP